VKGTRRKSRELLMQMLYQTEVGKQPPEDVAEHFWTSREGEVEPESRAFAEELFRAATERSAEVDALIEKHAQNWRLERMQAVDRNLLRGAVAELLAWPKTPHAVVINETLEVARRYAAQDSAKFLNGVLDAVARELLEKRLNEKQ
jgi:N utilization substance protein B